MARLADAGFQRHEAKSQEERMNDQSVLPRLQHTTTRRQMMVRTAACAGLALASVNTWAVAEEEISHSGEVIHQEPVFKASRKQVYEALTDPRQFDKVTRLSAAMKSMPAGSKPTEISNDPGGAFTLFSGYVVGRQIELVPNERIVQVWRPLSWKPGEYSIVRFDLTEQDSGTKIVFEHKGFPAGQAEHLAAGWKANYWEPLEKYLLTQQ
jgi:activator of HSP90 ATPase